jgi:hypothetical protein
MTTFSFCGRKDLGGFEWPRAFPSGTREYFSALLEGGISRYLSNSDEEFCVARLDDTVIPLVINPGGGRACYLTSPTCHYVKYARDFVAGLEGSAARLPLLGLLRALEEVCGSLLLDKVVYVNNWLIPTQPTPALGEEQARALAERLSTLYPEYAIVLKGVQPRVAPELPRVLAASGYELIVHRQLYYWDPAKPEVRGRSNVGRDQQLLRNTKYRVTRLEGCTDGDLERLLEIYNSLYTEKHSEHSIQYKAEWLALAWRSGLLDFQVIGKDGRTDAFFTSFRDGPYLVSSIGGHDTAVDSKFGLYRLCHASLIKQAMANQCPLNMSSGVGPFKKLRGAEPDFEYEALYIRHLPSWRRLPWRMLANLYNTLGKKVFVDFEV